MNKFKLLVTGFLTVILGSTVAVGAALNNEAHHAEAATTTRVIYFDAGGTGLWDQAGAIFWGHFWGAGDQDVRFLDNDGDGVYEATINAGQTDVIITRNKSNSTGPWNNEWNRVQTKIPSDNDCVIITGWSSDSCEWVSLSNSTFYLTGTFNSWATNSEDYKFEYNSQNNNYVLETTLTGKVEFKVTQGNWDWSKGAGKFTSETVTLSGSDNCVITNSGTNKFIFTLPAFFRAPSLKLNGTVELITDKDIVDEFVATYMHMEDVSTDNLADTGKCRGDDGYYALAKAAYDALTDSQKELFQTDATYADAWARFQKWADANDESVDSAQSSLKLLTPLSETTNNDYVLYVIIGILAISTVGICVFIKRRKTTR